MAFLLRKLGFAERAVGPDGKRVRKVVQPPLTNAQACAARPLPDDEFSRVVPNPGRPRTNTAPSRENPTPSPGSGRADHTALQQHVDFFDRDGDGIIYPRDTYVGFRRIGFGRLISFLAIFVIHGTFSYPTSPTWIPSLWFPIYINRMHRTKHGSDSSVYDTEGRFVPEKFEELFSKFDSEHQGALSWDDIQDLVYDNMNVNDVVGWIAGRLEWWVLWLAASNGRGMLSRETVRAQYDGSLWQLLSDQATKKRGYEIFSPKRHKARATASAQPAKPPPREKGTADGMPSGSGKKQS